MSDKILLESFLFNNSLDKKSEETKKSLPTPREVKRSVGSLTKLLNPTIKELLIKALNDVQQNDFERAMSVLGSADKLMNILCLLKAGDARGAHRELKELGSLKNVISNSFVAKVTALAGKSK